ncbi:MAG: hypothetical protein RLZZ390_1158 [Bacteroidota bacterium]
MKNIFIVFLLFAFQFSVAQQAPEPSHPVLKQALKRIADFNNEERQKQRDAMIFSLFSTKK